MEGGSYASKALACFSWPPHGGCRSRVSSAGLLGEYLCRLPDESPFFARSSVVREFETDPEALFEFTQQLKAQSARSSRFQFVNSARLGGASRPEDIEGKRTLTNTECANLLHPKPRGFNKVARVCWGPAFAAAELL